MHCPTCHGTELVTRKRLGISLQICPSCRGAWLERQTIEQLSEQTGIFVKARGSESLPAGPAGMKQPLWKELFDGA